MGVDTYLRDESGEDLGASVSDEKGLIARLVKGISQDEFPFIGSIDLYGNTMFNQQQMPRFLAEWQQMSGMVQSTEQQAAYEAVASLATRCAQEDLVYLWFIGD